MADDLSKKVKKGYLWMLLSTVASQGISFCIGVVLARALRPEEFGIFAAIMVFTEVASTVVSSGFVSVLLQRQENRDEHFSTAFVLALMAGGGACLTLTASARWIGAFLNSDLAARILGVLSLNFLLLPFSSITTAILRRQIRFRTIMTIDIGQLLAQGILSIVLAINGFGVWSLVWGKLGGHLVMIVHSAAVARWVPRLCYDRRAGRDLLTLGGQFAAKNILNDFGSNIDYLMVGRYLGAEQLGYYSRAYYLMTLPVTRISSSLGVVLFPAFAMIQDDRPRVLSGFLKATCGIALVSFPVLVGLYLVAPAFIHIAYGEKWMATVPPLQIMCLGGLFYAMEPVAIAVINAKGYLMAEIRRHLIFLILIIVGVYAGSAYGVVGVSYAVLSVSFCHWLMLQRLLKKLILLPLKDYYHSLAPAMIASLFMFIAVRIYQFWVLRYFPMRSLPMFLSSVLLGVLSYVAGLFMVRTQVTHPLVLEVFQEVEGQIFPIWEKLTRRRVMENPRL